MGSTPSLDNIPEELTTLRRWVTWRYEQRGNKRTKKPTPNAAKESAWLSLAEARDRAASANADGVGFVLGAGIAGIDLDNCIAEDGTLHDIARDALKLGTYAEHSPSRRGLHFFIRGKIARSQNIRFCGAVPGHEIYDGRIGSARYFTVTGDRIGDAASLAGGPEAQCALDAFVAKWFGEEEQHSDEAAAEVDDDELLKIMFAAKDGARWRAVFNGDVSHYPSPSEADLALCGKLRFYTRGNAAQVDRIFRRSVLMRPKWNVLHGAQTYGALTIKTALAKGGPVYKPRDRSDEDARRNKHERTAWGKMPLWWGVRLQRAGALAFRVLLVIASHADTTTGEAFPSVATIAAHCRVSERRVQTAIATLKAAGIVTITQRPRHSNLYRLALTVPETITPYAAERAALRVTDSGH